MLYNSIDENFINYWISKDFSTWNEADIREELIAPMLRVLGYSKNTVNDVIREKSLDLGTPYHRIGRQKVSIDYLPTVRLRSFWIIEAKSGIHKEMDYGDLLQAHLYAIHPEIQVPFIVLCNGWFLKIYDSQRITNWNEPLFTISQDNCKEKFNELKEILGAEQILEFQRVRILQNIENTFSAEIDIKQLTELKNAFNRKLLGLEKQIKENERNLERSIWHKQEKEEEEELLNTTSKNLIIHMDIVTYHMLRPANEYIRRIENSDTKEATILVSNLAQNFRARPHSIFRVNCLYILLTLLNKNMVFVENPYFKNIINLFEEVAVNNTNYCGSSPLVNALCHLDNTCCRLAKKFAVKGYMEVVSKHINDLKQRLPVYDLIEQRPSIAREIVKLTGLHAEFLWRLFCGETNPSHIWEGIWMMEDSEKIIEKLPDKKYPDGDSDLLSFESYGRGYDLLFMGSWSFLNKNIELLTVKGTCSSILDFAKMNREEAISAIPKAKEKPNGYKYSEEIISRLKTITSFHE